MRCFFAKPDRVPDRAPARLPQRRRRWNSRVSSWPLRELDGGAWRARILPCGRLCVSCLRHQQELFGEMARDLPEAEAAQFWHCGLAHSGAQRATAIEAANVRIGIDRAARLAGQ